MPISSKQNLSVATARKILGHEYTDYSDEQIESILGQLYILAGLVLNAERFKNQVSRDINVVYKSQL